MIELGKKERKSGEANEYTVNQHTVNQQMKSVLKAAFQISIIATEPDGLITIFNSGAENMLGYKADELEGKCTPAIIHLNSEVESYGAELSKLFGREIKGFDIFITKALQNGYDRREWTYVRKDGSYVNVDLAVNAIYDDENQLTGFLGVAQDITERKKTEDQLRQSQKMEAVGQLAGGIAHDFNNILGGIVGAAELLFDHVIGDEEALDYLKMIQQSAERASNLNSKLLAFSRKQTISSHPIDMHDLINSTISILQNTIDRRIIIKSIFEADQNLVVGDDAQLQSVLLNIGINASHAMPEGGVMTFSTRLIDLSVEYCDHSLFELTPGCYLDIEVNDTGSGIEKKLIDKIFEPFFTTKELGKGTGLGLAAAFGTMVHHKGAINVYSELGTGTSFHLLLPLASEKEQVKQLQQIKMVGGKAGILVVDDEKIMRITASAILTNLGYTIFTASNGKEALEVYKENQNKIDLVILDMIMPELNGRDCFNGLKAMNENIKVILSSGFTRDEDLQELQKSGLKGFIRKPYRGIELSQMVQNVLSEQS